MHKRNRPNLFYLLLFYSLSFTFFSGTWQLEAQVTVTSAVAQGSDDAEEEVSSGIMDLSSSDLELTSDGGTNQWVGIRFQNITVPQGATILSASIQFTVDETDSGNTSVQIWGHDTDNSGTFTNTVNDISNRTRTSASVNWNNIPAWNTVGQAGIEQETPDITTIVQEIVNRGGWSSGNAMSFVITGSGERTAESFNGSSSQAPVLKIVVNIPQDPLPSIVPNNNRALPFIYFMADNRSELYSVAPDPGANPLPIPTITNVTFGGSPITFSGEGGGYRSTDRQVYVFQGPEPTNSSDLYSIDPATGVATLVRSNIVPGHVDGAEFWINNDTGEEVLVILYQNGTSGGADRIMAVNPNASGSIPAWSAYSGYPVALSGARTRADGISWNPDTAEFYIQNDNNVDYYTVNITTGVTTFAFTTSLGVDGEGITYAADGTNYIEDENNVGQGRTIFVVDTDTGNLIPAAQLGSTGDVESIMGNLGSRNDAGDAPSSYGFAAHRLPVLTTTPLSVYLGAVPPDSENPFVNYSTGFSDDNTGDDEDGVTSGGADFSGQSLNLGLVKTIDISTNGSGVLNAWIDFNRDGDFDDAGEQIATDIPPIAGSITLNVLVPSGASPGISYARFRYSSDTGIAPGNSEVSDGEVEDYQILLRDTTTCPSGNTPEELIENQHVHATAVIIDQSVGNETNALGNDPNTTASFNSDSDELILEMGQGINNGDSVTVYGEDGDDFDIWVSSTALGPWTQVGTNAQLDYTFTSPVNWLYIRFRRGDGSGTENLAYIDATSTTITTVCSPDYDNDGIADRADLDDDNDGLRDCDESSDSVAGEFGWSLNNPTGNLNVDYVEDTRITDWAVASSGTLSASGIGWNNSSSNVTITNMPASNLPQAISNGDYVEVSFTTDAGVSHFELDNIRSGWFTPSEGDSYYSSTQYMQGATGVWVTLSEDVFHTDDGSSYAVFDHMDQASLGLLPNTTYTFRFFVYGQIDDSGQNYSVFDDIYFDINACRAMDSDSDGVNDHFDLDTDNDGIYDVVEAGHDQPHTNGVVNGNYGANGLADQVETTAESGILNYSIANSDGVDAVDFRDTDSDNDGCNDADEAYADASTDSDDNGSYGSGSPAVNTDGSVSAAAYPSPADEDGNATYDYREAGVAPTISLQPVDTAACPGCTATFSTNSPNADGFQWQLFSGGSWTDLSDTGIYSGTQTATLTIDQPTAAENGNQYRVLLSSASYVCDATISNTAILTIRVNTVITNRRITYRVNKN